MDNRINGRTLVIAITALTLLGFAAINNRSFANTPFSGPPGAFVIAVDSVQFNDSTKYCEITFAVQNNTDKRISRFRIDAEAVDKNGDGYEIDFSVAMKNIRPGKTKTRTYRLYSKRGLRCDQLENIVIFDIPDIGCKMADDYYIGCLAGLAVSTNSALPIVIED